MLVLHLSMKKFLSLLFIFTGYTLTAQNFTTTFETSKGKQTATYFECINFYKSLSQSFSTIKILTGDTTDAGYPLHVVLFSADTSCVNSERPPRVLSLAYSAVGIIVTALHASPINPAIKPNTPLFIATGNCFSFIHFIKKCL